MIAKKYCESLWGMLDTGIISFIHPNNRSMPVFHECIAHIPTSLCLEAISIAWLMPRIATKNLVSFFAHEPYFFHFYDSYQQASQANLQWVDQSYGFEKKQIYMEMDEIGENTFGRTWNLNNNLNKFVCHTGITWADCIPLEMILSHQMRSLILFVICQANMLLIVPRYRMIHQANGLYPGYVLFIFIYQIDPNEVFDRSHSSWPTLKC